MVGLLCLRRGLAGGLSSIVSSVTVHNEILAAHPEYLRPLYNGFHYIRREAALTERGVSERPIPVFGHAGDVVSCRYIRNQINAGAVKRGVPLTAVEAAALDHLDEQTRRADLRLDMDLQPGDLQLINNYTILHSRTGFVDGELPHQKRHTCCGCG
jgi:alpha-ketoglutarate-dependent taurine dioxygenase